MRACQGKVDWIARGTNPFIAYPLARSRQCMPKNDTTLIHEINRIISQTALDVDVSYYIYPIDVYTDDFKVIAHGDSGFRNAGMDNNSTQAGYVIGVARDDGDGILRPYSVLAWKTHKLRRTVRSTLAAETMALSEAMEMGELVRAYLLEFRHARRLPVRTDYVKDIEIMGITDCRDLYDCVSGLGRRPTEVRLVMDIQALREYTNVQYRWVATVQQIADPLTKAGVDWYFRHVMENGECMYQEDPDLVAKVAAMRQLVQARRERAKTKHKQSSVKAAEYGNGESTQHETAAQYGNGESKQHETAAQDGSEITTAGFVTGFCTACAMMGLCKCCCRERTTTTSRTMAEEDEARAAAPRQSSDAAPGAGGERTTLNEPLLGKAKAVPKPKAKPKAKPKPSAPVPERQTGKPCPKCSGPMMFKAANRGGFFWGCATWPACDGTRRPHDV